jgi:GTP-binding protein
VKFIDEAIITVQSGNGGAGCVSFRRERFIPRGGPDGGDGGKGGDIVLQTTARKRTLYHLQHKKHFKASNGSSGQGKKKTGANGQPLFIELPPGTIVADNETGEIIKDFVHPGEVFTVALGGRGGQGNARFKSSTHRAPRFAQPGEPGRTIMLKLELKLLADVGLVGLPNAGKSTLIRSISSAKPKVGNYPFTTLTPSLGVVQTNWSEPFVVADIPGLIEGAHRGAGLGIRFLRHIERTRVLIHLIDVSTVDPEQPLKDYNALIQELERFETNLAVKPQLLVLNKMDLPGSQERADLFKTALDRSDILAISAQTGQGIDQMLTQILAMLDHENAS